MMVSVAYLRRVYLPESSVFEQDPYWHLLEWPHDNELFVPTS